jgi:hypothetical protein
MAEGVPEGAELELPAIAGRSGAAGDADRTGADAAHLQPRAAARPPQPAQGDALLDEAGWAVGDDGSAATPPGEPLRMTFLFNTSSPPR